MATYIKNNLFPSHYFVCKLTPMMADMEKENIYLYGLHVCTPHRTKKTKIHFDLLSIIKFPVQPKVEVLILNRFLSTHSSIS